MFRANDNHGQQSITDISSWMDPRVLKKLEKTWAPTFYEHVFCKIDEAPFAELYDASTGRPNFPVNILLSLEYIKHMRNCSDLELLDAYHFDYLVNYAVGNRGLGGLNLAERTLYHFRERVYRYSLDNPGKEDLLFGQFVGLLHVFAEKAEVSLEKQRTDTTLFMSNIKKAGRVSLAFDVLARAVKAVPEKERTEALAQVLGPDFKTDVLYRAKATEGDGKLSMLLNLCQETLRIMDGLAELLNSEERRILARFIDEQSEADAASGKLVPKPKGEITSGSLQSAYDEDATYRKKSGIGQSGYALGIAETCDRENPFQLITDYTVKPNNVSDQEILEERIPVIKENTGCTDMYADGGFHGEGVHKAAVKHGMEIHLTNMCGTQPVKKIPVSEFDIDETTNTILKCPGGHAPIRVGISGGQSSAHFPHEACAGCELQGQCYSKKQVKDNVVRINIKAIDTSRVRAAMKENRKENTSMRAGIEGTNSALKRTGQGKLEVRGITRSKIVSGLKQTSQNIKRFIKFMRGGYKRKVAKSRISGVAVPICG